MNTTRNTTQKSRISRAPILAARWGVYAKPKPNEDRFISALLRKFPGSELVLDDDQPPLNSERPLAASAGSGAMSVGVDPREGGPGASAVLEHRLDMLAVLDQAIAYGKEQSGLPPLELGRKELFDVAIIGATKFDQKKLERYLKKLEPGTTVVTGDGKGVEKLVAEKYPTSVVDPLRKDLYGSGAMSCQVEQVMCLGRRCLLVGTGGRVTAAEGWLKRKGNRSPSVLRLL